MGLRTPIYFEGFLSESEEPELPEELEEPEEELEPELEEELEPELEEELDPEEEPEEELLELCEEELLEEGSPLEVESTTGVSSSSLELPSHSVQVGGILLFR